MSYRRSHKNFALLTFKKMKYRLMNIDIKAFDRYVTFIQVAELLSLL